ncbi:hypothetical protein C4B68_17340 [Streptomyces dengpaensis]|uniref:Uncharacterized protein n=1 Tax=Streptomyces dengpaensis TaxID=2049881 RepID=A0ABM6SRG9_9ACTN|nr:hypothetical protein C4B68_17340 [Streptomyces dengpaensis]
MPTRCRQISARPAFEERGSGGGAPRYGTGRGGGGGKTRLRQARSVPTGRELPLTGSTWPGPGMPRGVPGPVHVCTAVSRQRCLAPIAFL